MKKEDLLNGIEELDDKYIEEAIDYKSKTPKKIVFAVAAAVLCIGMVGVYGVVKHNIGDSKEVNQVAKSETIEAPKVNSGLVVIAKASEMVEKDTKMEKGVKISFAEYGQWMSNLPAMPFSFEYNNNNITGISIKVSCGDNGVIQQWADKEGIWSKTYEGKSITCKPFEKVYWQSSSFENTSEDIMTVEVIKEDKVIEKKGVKIWLDKEKWCFVGELME